MPNRQFHYQVVYSEATGTWYVEAYEGYSDGDIYDLEAGEWRYADDDEVKGEQDLDGLLYKILQEAVAHAPTVSLDNNGHLINEEPDVLYQKRAK